MLTNGFIKLHRKMTEWEWYTDTNTKVVFIHLIFTANYKPKRFQGRVIEIGQRVASYETLAIETGLTVQNVRTAIKHLMLTNEVTIKSTNKYTVFTVVNYSFYQDNQRQANKQTNNQLTINQQSTNNQLTINQQSTNNNERKQEYKESKKARIYIEDEPNGSTPTSEKAKPVKHKYGEYSNVLLSDSDMDKLKTEFPSDWTERIERLSSYMASTGKSYKNHLATIRNWARNDKNNNINTQTQNSQQTKDPYSIDNIRELFGGVE